MHLLHLFDDASPQASSTTLALLAASQDDLRDNNAQPITQRILLLGGQTLGQAVANLNLPHAQRIGAPLRQPLMAWPAVRHALQRFETLPGNQSLQHPDIVHCWSAATFTLASLYFRNAMRLLTVTTPPPARTIQWLRMLVAEARGNAAILTISSTLRRDLLAGGLPESAVHVLRPGIDLAMVQTTRRDALRAELGIEPGDRVVALLSDPPCAADAAHADMATGLADESSLNTGQRVRLLMHPDQHNHRRARRIIRDLGRHQRIITDPRITQPWSILPACDAALASGPDAGGLSLLWAMAAGLPIVGEARYAISEVVEDRHSALLSKPGAARVLAMGLTRVFSEPQLAWKLRDTARHEAYSYFSRHRYRQSLATVYRQAIERQPLTVPEMEVTGGLRFAAVG